MKKILSVVFSLFIFGLFAQEITLTHNVGNIPIDTGMPNCEYEEYWARTFILSEFGISTNEQFIIRSGQVAISQSYEGARIGINVFSIDSNFPKSDPKALGYGGSVETPLVDGIPQIIQIDFNRPIVVPAGVERILVVASQSSDHYNPDYTDIIIAGTKEDNDVSWFSGCREYYDFTTTDKLNEPVPNANFFINITGEVFNQNSVGSDATLTHNVCDKPIWVNQYGRSGGGIKFARAFYLDDFGISNNEEYIIHNGQVAFSGIGAWDVRLQFNIYSIDSNFPDSFSTSDLIGSSQVISPLYYSDRYNPIIFTVDFDSPVIVPRNVERILVEVYHFPSTGYSAAFIAGTEYGSDVSWLSNGVFAPYNAVNLDYYINVTGNVNHVTNNFEMNISNICSEFLKEFSVESKDNIASVIWDFGDPASGLDNTSTDLSPFHDFSQDGTYTITATVTGKGGRIEELKETIDVKEPPNVYGIGNIYACEDSFNTGFSSSFDLTDVEVQILGGQSDKLITYIDGSGNEYNSLPNQFTNTVKDRETITVRVSHIDNPCCYSEITFDLIVNSLPSVKAIEDLTICDDNDDGFAFFDLKAVEQDIIGNGSNIQVEFYNADDHKIEERLDVVENSVIKEEEITVKAINTDTGCSSQTIFKLIVNPLPIANILTELIGCDDDGDGISEYFDTSNVETEVLGNQTGMEVVYFDAENNELPSPLPNPFLNTIAYQETFTVRVLNPLTGCYAETPLVLTTSTQPKINKPSTIYACDTGSGFASFNTSHIKLGLIGNQTGLNIKYFDANGNFIESPLPTNFKNTQPWQQTINVRVENELNSLCYSETSFDLVVNQLPEVMLDETYFLCNL